jgi:isopentenyl diphosphate isomerase/L-lactate dehydrogenase-like FMN-dependent dehydrogenase
MKSTRHRTVEPTRREVLSDAGGALAGTLLGAQTNVSRARPAAQADLVNVLEYEDQAGLRLESAIHALTAGSDRTAFDRITLRPRMMVPTRDMDLGVMLFVESLVDVAGVPIWFQVYVDDPAAQDTLARAVEAGCRAACVTMGVAVQGGGARAAATGPAEWNAVGSMAAALGAPVVVKGVATPDEARAAVDNGARGIVFSDHGGQGPNPAPVLGLADVVDAVNGRVPVLADGSFRRGTDILKALAFGAAAVLVARPVIWGLAAYGEEGVQGVLEMLQTELARAMAMCGRPRLETIDRSLVRVHEALPGA